MGGDVTLTGLRATRRTGHLYAQWSLAVGDSVLGYTPPSRLYHNIVDHVRPGSIILMHVTHPETLAALPSIVRELKRRGYKMVTLSQMAAMGKPYPSWYVR
jgi:peptidoglycan/xylan/chitin deacetylase (PgdA/CDA1 family)